MVKSKSGGIKEYEILLETCVQYSSVQLPNTLTPWPCSGLYGLFGDTAQGTHQPGCPRAGITPCSLAAFPFPSSHPLLHLPGSPDPPIPWNLLKIVLWFCEGANELQSWCRKSRRRAQSGASMGSKEQPQSWHSWAPLDCSALISWWGCCRNRLQTNRLSVAEPRKGWLKGREGQQCLH